jgi:hypothetical protein
VLDQDAELLQRTALHLQQALHDLSTLISTGRQAAHLCAQTLLNFRELVRRMPDGEALSRGSRIDLALEGCEQPGHALVGSKETLAQEVDRREFQLVV